MFLCYLFPDCFALYTGASHCHTLYIVSSKRPEAIMRLLAIYIKVFPRPTASTNYKCLVTKTICLFCKSLCFRSAFAALNKSL